VEGSPLSSALTVKEQRSHLLIPPGDNSQVATAAALANLTSAMAEHLPTMSLFAA
jgi:hypothetical protein